MKHEYVGQSGLNSCHWEEIVVRSGVGEQIARLNFRTIEDPRELDRSLNLNVHQRWQHSHHLTPGWLGSGVDPKTGESTMLGVQYKPDVSPTNSDGKPVKYLSPVGEPTQPTFLDTGNPNYWPQVLALLSTTIFLIEGLKKAGCLLSLDYAAVSLPGVWNGQAKGRLKESVKQLCGVGRLIYLCFDSDMIVKPQVQQALDRLGRLLIIEGCVVRVVVWDNQYKGIDDLYIGAGAQAVHDAIANALTFEEWREQVKTIPLTPSIRPGTAIVGWQPTDSHLMSHYESHPEDGLYWVSYEQLTEKRLRVGDHMVAIAYVDSSSQDGASLYLEFMARNRIRRVTISRAMLAGDAIDVLKMLNALSYFYVRAQRNRLIDYLNQAGKTCDREFTVTDKTGWVGNSFVLPDRTYGNPNLRFERVEPPTEIRFQIRGTLAEWQNYVAAKTVGNSRLTFALGVALAGPLNPILELESGGFHLFGPTSTGKSTTAYVAASVYGPKSQVVRQWRTTANGLEGTAAEHNHLALPIDEIGQALPRDVASSAYLLANGQGKTRMKKNTKVTPPKQWNLTFLSTGEISLADYLRQAGITTKGGQENRMPSIPACPDQGHGVFEICHGQAPGEFARTLEQSCEQYVGTALDAYLTRLVQEIESSEFRTDLVRRHAEIMGALVSETPFDEVIGRVAQRFSGVQVGLELAVCYGILPHSLDQVDEAIKIVFADWINERGGAGSIELKQALERIEHLFVSNEHSDRIYHVDGHPDQTTRNLLAYRKKDDFEAEDEFWVPPTIFSQELAVGIDRQLMIQELQARGWLKGPDGDGKNTIRRRIGKKQKRFYVFRAFWGQDTLD